MNLPRPRYFLLREVRFGPLVPARLWFDDAEPGEPENKRDRGRLSVYPRADVAGVEVDPDRLAERLYEGTAERPAIAASHWKYPQPIAEADYHYHLARLRWAETARPDDPTLRSRRKVDPASVPLPLFDKENAI